MSLSSLRTVITDRLEHTWSWFSPKQAGGRRTWILAGLAAGCGALLMLHLRRKRRPLPPGPTGLPFIGAIGAISEDMHLDMMRLGRKYGDVISMKIGPTLMVVLNSHSAIKEAFVRKGDLFAARPKHILTTDYMKLNDEIFSAEYDGDSGRWMKNKKFLMSSVRLFGFGNVGSEERMLDGINRLLQNVYEHSGKPISISELFPKVAATVILHILFNKQYSFEDEKLNLYLSHLHAWYQTALKDAMVLGFVPKWVGRLFFSKLIEQLGRSTAALKTLILEEIDEHITNYDPDNILDFVDTYIQGRGLENIDREIFTSTTFLFLPDAVDTVAATMDWVVLYLTKFTDVQARVQDDIDDIIGPGRKVMWADQSRLPYVEAAIMETMRIVTPAVISASHCALRDTYFRGYFIPKEAHVLANIYAAHMDPEVYEDPQVFRPERFLDSQGSLIKDDHWIPFGMGRRMCLGEQLAKMEVFLMITNLLQQFDLSFPEGQPEPSLEPRKDVLVRKPSPYEIVVIERR